MRGAKNHNHNRLQPQPQQQELGCACFRCIRKSSDLDGNVRKEHPGRSLPVEVRGRGGAAAGGGRVKGGRDRGGPGLAGLQRPLETVTRARFHPSDLPQISEDLVPGKVWSLDHLDSTAESALFSAY